MNIGTKTKESIPLLAAQASKGDEESFVLLCDILKMQLFRTAKGILNNDTLALCAVDEAVYKAYKGIGRLRKPEYAATWFMRILINAANDIYRQNKLETSLSSLPEEAYNEDYSKLNFDQLISFLPLNLRHIISLKYYSQYTLAEISDILKIPAGTVKSRLNKALKLLRLEVKE